MRDHIQDAFDKVVGGTATLLGSAGITVQWWVGVGDLVLMGMNILLAIGGLHLLYLRVRRARRDMKDKKDR